MPHATCFAIPSGNAKQTASISCKASIKRKLLMNEITLRGKLVNAEQLLDQLFTPESRPSLRWLRTQTKAKVIPYVRLGHLVFFKVEMVRSALTTKRLVRTRQSGSATTCVKAA